MTSCRFLFSAPQSTLDFWVELLQSFWHRGPYGAITAKQTSIHLGTIVFHLDDGIDLTRLGKYPHVSWVVGWGRPVDEREWESGNFTIYTTAGTAANDCSCDPVPYVMDRGFGNNDSLLRGPRAYNDHEPNYSAVEDDPNTTSNYEFWSRP